MRDDRRRRVAAVLVDHDLDAVGGKHLDRARQRRLGQRVGVDADEQRTGQCRFRGDSRRSPALVARIWSSLKEFFSDEPRCPEVPKATRWAARPGPAFRQNRPSHSRGCWPARRIDGLPASGLISAATWVPSRFQRSKFLELAPSRSMHNFPGPGAATAAEHQPVRADIIANNHQARSAESPRPRAGRSLPAVSMLVSSRLRAPATPPTKAAARPAIADASARSDSP